MANTNTDHNHTTDRRISTETKSSYKTTELIAYVVAVLGVLVASAMVDEAGDFGPQREPPHHRLHDQPWTGQVR